MRKFNKKIFSLAAIIGLGTITTCSTVITSCGASEAKNLTIDGVPTVIGTIINNAGSWSNSFKLLNDGKEVDNSKVEWKLFSNEPEENEEKDISFLKIENGLIYFSEANWDKNPENENPETDGKVKAMTERQILNRSPYNAVRCYLVP